jgi:2-C-methyl-D-erythritol 4-phosphate cytidylyltransferase
MTRHTDCIIVAAGSGTRLGAGRPKAFVRLAGAPLFVHSLRQFAGHAAIGRIVVVVPAALTEEANRIIAGLCVAKDIKVVAGGKHRWHSVKNGVEACTGKWVLIHDAARPFVTLRVIDAVIVASARYDAVIAATPEVDTVRGFSGDRALETLDRSKIVRVQTPQMFLRDKLLAAFERARFLAAPPTDEAMLMETAGIPVGIAQGDPLNFKITSKEDLELAEALCGKRGENTPHKK